MNQNENFSRRQQEIVRHQTLFDRYIDLPYLPLLGLFGDAVSDACRKIKTPYASAIAVGLTAASTATQALFDVDRPIGGRTTLSLYTLLIADSGERKSSLINYFFGPIREAEIAAEHEYRKRLSQWERDINIWEIHRKELQKNLSKSIAQDIAIASAQENIDD